jgi:cytochrome c-type biogenesis protein
MMLDLLSHTSLLAAFLAGLLSFVSPCVLPLVPSYVSYISGVSFDQLRQTADRHLVRRSIVVNTLLFIVGFSAVFIGFGASASFVGQMLFAYQTAIRKTGAVLVMFFGLYLTGLITIPALMMEKRVHFIRRPAGYLGSVVIGATFAAGWTPCVGPVLGTMLLYAGAADTLMDGVTLLAFYSLGLGMPLLTVALALDRFLASAGAFRPYLRFVSVLSGVFVIVFGVVMYLDDFGRLTSAFERYGIGTYLGQGG